MFTCKYNTNINTQVHKVASEEEKQSFMMASEAMIRTLNITQKAVKCNLPAEHV